MSTKLSVHLPFCVKMLAKVKNSEFESKWQKLYNLIKSDEVTEEHAAIIDKTLKELRAKFSAKLENDRDPAAAQNNEQPVQTTTQKIIKEVTKPPNENLLNDLTKTSEKTNLMKTKSHEISKSMELHEKKTSDCRQKIPLLKIKLSEVFKKGNKKRLLKDQKKKLKKLKKLEKKAERQFEDKQDKKSKENEEILEQSTGINPAKVSSQEAPEVTKEDPKISSKTPEVTKEDPKVKIEAPEVPLEASIQKEFLSCSVPLVKHDERSGERSPTTSIEIISSAVVQAGSAQLSDEEDAEMSLLVEIKSENFDDIIKMPKETHETVIGMAESKKLSKPLKRPLSASKIIKKPAKKEVSHMSFRIINKEVLFVCKVCDSSTDSYSVFRHHIALSHPKIRWFGSCHSCSKQKHSKTGNLMDELQHMLQHLKAEGVSLNSLEKPKAPMVSIPSDMVKMIEKSVTVSPVLKVLLDPASTLKRLRPWLSTKDVSTQKFFSACEKMMSIECLSALFKCMGISCSFYTSQTSVFEQHLNYHVKYQKDDFYNFSNCCYCDFKALAVNELVEHVVNEHGADKYQCKYCFYRSYDFQVCEHSRIFHKAKEDTIIKCTPKHQKNEILEMQAAWLKCKRHVPSMTCMVCKSKFYNFTCFREHFKEHSVFPSSRCIKCKREIKDIKSLMLHLQSSCHGIARFQCSLCVFGVNYENSLMLHLVHRHPNKIPFFFDRTIVPKFNEENTLIQGKISMAKMCFKKYPNCVVVPAPKDEKLLNSRNVNRLSENFEILG